MPKKGHGSNSDSNFEIDGAFISATKKIARRWADTPYYDAVEKTARNQWKNLILPFLHGYTTDFSHVLELAPGHGRITEILLSEAQSVTAIDVNSENIQFCRERFGDNPKLKLAENNGVTLEMVEDETISFVFCFDSMVHFDSDVVRAYLREFYRIMNHGATCFLHHSNLDKNPGGDFQKNIHARNFMTVELMSHYAQKEGLQVLKQEVLDWGRGDKMVRSLDGFTLLLKPGA